MEQVDMVLPLKVVLKVLKFITAVLVHQRQMNKTRIIFLMTVKVMSSVLHLLVFVAIVIIEVTVTIHLTLLMAVLQKIEMVQIKEQEAIKTKLDGLSYHKVD